MKKILALTSLIAILLVLVFSLDLGTVNGATVGDRLPNPEAGWKRFDDTEVAFVLKGSWKSGISPVPTNFYKGTHTGSIVKGDTIEFEFKGTQLRVLSRKGTDRPKDLKAIIDGNEEVFSANGPFTTGFDIVYEKKGLENKKHKVIIENGDGRFYFDAIDIDADGELLPPGSEEPTPPTPEPENPNETDGKSKLYVANESVYKLNSGDVYAWGENKYGQLGLGDTKKRSITSKGKVNLPEKIVDLVVGKNFVVALGESGKVYGWGDNTSELYGDNGGLILSPVEFDKDIQSIIKAE